MTKRVRFSYISFTVAQMTDGDYQDPPAGTVVDLDPYTIRSVHRLSSGDFILCADHNYCIDQKDVERILASAMYPDPSFMTDDTLQEELEAAERWHTMLLSELERRRR